MLRVLFAGTPECAVPSLEKVARAHHVVAILTNPATVQGRSGKLVSSPVAQEAERLINEGLLPRDTPIITPKKITDSVREAIAATKPDILACFAFGKIFGPKTLSLFPLGAINVHPSLLPRWRGCAPIPATILAQDTITGITVQKMALEMDAGDILLTQTIDLDGSETTDSLLIRAADEGAQMLVQVLDGIVKNNIIPIPQDHTKATFSSMLCKEDGEITWSDTAKNIDARIRAFTSWPGAWTKTKDRTLIILKAHIVQNNEDADLSTSPPGTVLGSDKKEGILVQTGKGIIALENLQWRTKKPLDWKSFLNGTRDFFGTVLGI
ncbi:MAG TPA: methionyl-tRNA formyltransferase [Treponemataceae bacterium]|nr:methionyl-tRNA formyltransferase [Treponemataceae bacterium]